MKHCKDCKYSYLVYSMERDVHLACVYGVIKEEDPIDGHNFYPTWGDCWAERTNGTCGKDAKNYKPKWYLWWRK